MLRLRLMGKALARPQPPVVFFFNFILRAAIVDSVVQCASLLSLAIDGFPPQH
jgi:hypothetical protein